MKRMLWILFVVLLCSVAYARTSAAPAVRVTLLNQEPDPVSAGGYVDLKYKIENTGSGQAKNFTLELEEKYPFSLDPNQDSVINVGTLGAFQSDTESVIVEYRVRVDDRAVDGDNTVMLQYSYMYANRRNTFEIEDTVSVRAIDATLSIQEITTDPEQIAPGSDGMVTVRVANLASTTLRDISLQLDLSGDSLPLAPVGSATKKQIAVLEQGKIATFTFQVRAFPAAASGLYKIPISLEFYDTLNNEFTSEDLMSIQIGAVPEVVVVLDDIDLNQGFQRGTIPLQIINKGVSDVKFLDLEVLPSDAYLLLSASHNYIGNLDSDDFETLDVEVQNKDSSAESITVPIVVRYKDANNRGYEESFDMKVQLVPSELQQNGGIPSWAYILVIVIVGVVALVMWRRHRKCEKQKD